MVDRDAARDYEDCSMNALPCINSMHADSHAHRLGVEAEIEAEIERRTAEKKAAYRLDVEILSDAFGDVAATLGEYDKRYSKTQNPVAASFLLAVFNGTDDLECMRLIRDGMARYIDDMAADEASDEVHS
jgi:hypothetical protein